MNKNLKDRADILLQSIYLDGYEHGYKEAISSISNYQAIDNIRAEIKQLPYQSIFRNVSVYSLLDVVVEIIDKYDPERYK
jgi:hypothetical protein